MRLVLKLFGIPLFLLCAHLAWGQTTLHDPITGKPIRLIPWSPDYYSSVVSPECSAGEFAKNYSLLMSGIARVMNNADTSPHPEGLACMRAHHLRKYADKIASQFPSLTQVPGDEGWGTHPPVVFCETLASNDQKPALVDGDKTQGQVLGTYDFKADKIAFVKSFALNSEQIYAATFLHESVHRAGIADERLVTNITNCCMNGDAAACDAVDQKTMSMYRTRSRLTAYDRKLAGFDDLYTVYKNKVRGESDVAQIHTEMLLRDLSEKIGSLPQDYVKCRNSQSAGRSAAEGDASCITELSNGLQATATPWEVRWCVRGLGQGMSDPDALQFCHTMGVRARRMIDWNLRNSCTGAALQFQPAPDGALQRRLRTQASCLYETELQAQADYEYLMLQ